MVIFDFIFPHSNSNNVDSPNSRPWDSAKKDKCIFFILCVGMSEKKRTFAALFNKYAHSITWA